MSRKSAGPALSIDDLRRRATITIPEAAAFLSISVDLAYEAAKRGDLPCVSLGRRRLVISSRLLEMLAPKSDEA
jgi:excisionase family DNA binding protein